MNDGELRAMDRELASLGKEIDAMHRRCIEQDKLIAAAKGDLLRMAQLVQELSPILIDVADESTWPPDSQRIVIAYSRDGKCASAVARAIRYWLPRLPAGEATYAWMHFPKVRV